MRAHTSSTETGTCVDGIRWLETERRRQSNAFPLLFLTREKERESSPHILSSIIIIIRPRFTCLPPTEEAIAKPSYFSAPSLPLAS